MDGIAVTAQRPPRGAAVAAACVAVVTVLLAAGALALALRHRDVDQEVWSVLPATVSFAVVGGAIIACRPRNPVGWLFAVTGICFTAQQFLGHYAYHGLVTAPGTLAAPSAALWASTWLPAPGLVAAFVLMPLFFPDGRLPSRRWRPVAGMAVAWSVGTAVLVAVLPGGGNIPIGADAGLRNPLGIDALAPLDEPLRATAGPVFLGLTAVAVASLVVRYRRAGVPERVQITWLAYAVSVVLALFIADLALPWVAPVAAAGPILIPVAATVAILRHRLYDVELVINRTLLYVVLSGCVVAIYVGAVAALGAVVPAGDDLVVPLVATGLVAVLFAPLRARLQGLVNRRLYGHRDDPYRALSLLGDRLEATLAPDEVPAVVVATVAEALRLPYAAVEVGTGDLTSTAAEHGVRPPGDGVLLRLPLVHRDLPMGTLVLAPRSGGATFSTADRTLLADLARQVAAALHTVALAGEAVALAEDLQRSRHRLVTTREEERRRLGREIHDGVGPQLASVSMKAEAARELIRSAPHRAEELLADLLEQTEATVEDLRRMSHGLRPPALDALGLLGALRSHAGSLYPLRVCLDAPQDLVPLPAAVEIAAYRIVLEALHNVVRHAGAGRCRVCLSLGDEGLRIEVVDDGRGIAPDRPAGLGLSSMRERAEELGGRCRVAALPGGGTGVCAVLPCAAPDTAREA